MRRISTASCYTNISALLKYRRSLLYISLGFHVVNTYCDRLSGKLSSHCDFLSLHCSWRLPGNLILTSFIFLWKTLFILRQEWRDSDWDNRQCFLPEAFQTKAVAKKKLQDEINVALQRIRKNTLLPSIVDSWTMEIETSETQALLLISTKVPFIALMYLKPFSVHIPAKIYYASKWIWYYVSLPRYLFKSLFQENFNFIFFLIYFFYKLPSESLGN